MKVKLGAFNPKRWDHRNRPNLTKSMTPCRDAQAMGLYQVFNPLYLIARTSKLEDYTTTAVVVLAVECLVRFWHWLAME